MSAIVGGALALGYLLAGLFFLRFWKRTRDALFAYFAVAFWILAAQRLTLTLTADRFEDNPAFYLPRLLAFVLILFAIWQKNRNSNGA